MLLWMILSGALLLAGLAGLWFLLYQVRQLRFTARLSRGRPALAWCVSAAAVLIPAALIWAVWGFVNVLVVLLHFVIGWAAAKGLARLLFRRREPAFRRCCAAWMALAATVFYLGTGWVQANHVWQTSYRLTTEKPVQTLRIALLADAHVGTTFDGAGLAAHLARIQAQEPDLVVLAGDFVDEDTSRADMAAACRALQTLHPPFGVFFVFGNHDKGLYSRGGRGYSGDELAAELVKNGVTVLQDESVLIDGRFYLIGRQDASEALDFGGSRADMTDLMRGLDPGKFSIVLDHQPRDYAAEAAAGADLVLSGHTHGGQMIPLMQLADWFGIGGNDLTYGTARRAQTEFIVTSGISDWALQFKTGCRSEYVIIDVCGP